MKKNKRRGGASNISSAGFVVLGSLGFLLCSCVALKPSAVFKSPTAFSADPQLEALLEAVRGCRVGLLTNQTGVDRNYRAIADQLVADPEVTVAAFFSPEHGFRGAIQAGARASDFIDSTTGIPVYSLYGARRAPTDEQLRDIDVLIFDIQDVGSRFYTYVWTMTYAMEAAARNGVRFIVYDRPNPIGADKVEGAPIRFDAGLVGRVWSGQSFGVPTRHGMTAGELALLVNGEWMNPKGDLKVIPIPRYKRGKDFAKTGYPWVLPSPNMPTVDTALVYPGMCLFEGCNISEGRGTTRPFELIGAPFINGQELAARLDLIELPGVRFRPAYFTPTFDDYQGEQCGGIQLHVTDRDRFEPIRTALHILKLLYELHPDDLKMGAYVSTLMGVRDLHQRIKTESVESIIESWQGDLAQFKKIREKYLIY